MRAIAFLLTMLASAPGGPPAGETSAARPSDPTASRDAPSGGCALKALAADAALAADCTSCHDAAHAGSPSHGVGMDYAESARASRGRLKAAAEVSRRGLTLRGGKVGCVTCHDPRSPWASHVVLPQGATARAAVDVARPESDTPGAAAAPVAAGSRISTKPLCQSCHEY